VAISLYADVHIPQAITEQLRRRGVDVLTAIEDGTTELPDDKLLERATFLGRVLFTHDIRFKAMAQDWQRQDKQFAGLIFGHQLGRVFKLLLSIQIPLNPP
jgi:Domain of unknown function (DUF5615)